MQRLLTLVFLLCLAVPAGISISGCTRNPGANYCNGLGYGLKLTDVASIDLEPRTTGVSLAFGQTENLGSATAKNCKGTTTSVTSYLYGTTNNQLVDMSPSGVICAGTWNRRSGGGIPDFTICNKPSPLPSTGGLPYATAFVTATADAVTSNQVEVYVHAQVTAVSILLEDQTNAANIITGCLSQTQTAQLAAQAYYSLNGKQELLCGPNSTTVPSCPSTIGTFSFNSQNSAVANIDDFGVITAVLPGTAYITASVAGSGSSAGYFSTCPPASISLSLNGKSSGTVTQGVTQNLVTTILDTKGMTIQGLSLDYQSTNPLDITVGGGGAVTANFPGQASVYAVCQPALCNPSPIDKVGVNQTGTSVVSNSVNITTPGPASTYVWFASPLSQSYTPIELLTGSVGSSVRMPYFPNSMVMDRGATSLYFGSSHELMVYNALNNTLTKEDPNVPGVVLAVAPSNQTVLINDQIRKVFYLYSPTTASYQSFSGVGTSAEWTPDAKTLYVVGTDYSIDPAGVPTLFVDNANTGWTTYPLSAASSDLALTIPGVGAFLSGNPTVAHAWCPDVTFTAPATYILNQAYPQAASVAAQTDVLGATTDGHHIVGVGLGGGTTPTLSDINVDLSSSSPSLDAGACPFVVNSVGLPTSTKITTSPVSSFVQTTLPFQASVLNQVVVAPGSNLAFITYTASGTGTATLPYYEPTASGSLGTVGQVTLTGTPTAPIAGIFSLDDSLFFVSTSGDDLIHFIDVNTLTDTKQIKPGLLDGNGNPVPATFLAVKPRSTT